MSKIKFEKGSFRDPAGKIFYLDNRIFRLLENEGINRLEFLKKNNLLKNLIDKNFIIESKETNSNDITSEELHQKKIIEHKKLDYISYPYEWSFDQLKDAALHHLNLHIYLLNNNATLIDGSAFNIQFNAYKPVFIDLLSIRSTKMEITGQHINNTEFFKSLLLKSKKY